MCYMTLHICYYYFAIYLLDNQQCTKCDICYTAFLRQNGSAILLINGFVLVLFLNILLNGLTIGIELLETLWRERNAKILRRVLEVVKD